MLTAAPGRGTTQTVFMRRVGVFREKSLPALWMGKERGEVGGIPQAVSQGLVGWSQDQSEAGSEMPGWQGKGLRHARVEGASEALHKLEEAAPGPSEGGSCSPLSSAVLAAPSNISSSPSSLASV